MKLISLICLFAVAGAAQAQDFCKQIKKEVSQDKTNFDYASPFDPTDAPPVRVARSYSTNPEFLYDNFIVTFQVPCGLDSVYIKSPDGTQTEKDEHTLIVEFDDHSKITDDTIKITHDVTDDRSQALRVVYFPLTENTIKDFTNKKIMKFSLAGYEATVPADMANALMHYITCIKAVKP